MSLTLPLGLIFIAMFLLGFRRRRAGVLVLFISAAMFSLLGGGAWSRFVLDGLQSYAFVSKPEWKSKNAIVLLGAGTMRWSQTPEVISAPPWGYSRIYEAGRLYFSCKHAEAAACTVITSGGDPSENGISEAQSMASALESLGVAPGDLVLEDKSRNTFQNARNTAVILDAGAFEQIYLVTSGFHMRRSLLYFDYFTRRPMPAPSDHLNAIGSWLPVSFNFVFSDLALHEYGGILQFYFYNLMGWNPRPGAV